MITTKLIGNLLNGFRDEILRRLDIQDIFIIRSFYQLFTKRVQV